METDAQEEENKEIGNRLYEIREFLDLSQDEFAQVCEVKPKYISRIETGGTDVRISTINKLTKHIDMTKSEFFDYEKIPESLKTFRDKKLKRKFPYMFKHSKK